MSTAARPLDVGALRAGAVRMRWAGDSTTVAVRRLEAAMTALAGSWRGTAADTALSHVAGLAAVLRGVAVAYDDAGLALDACAGGLELSQATARRAEVVRALDEDRRQRAARQFPTTGPLPPWIQYSDLTWQAGALEAEAAALEQAAVTRAASALHALAEQVRAGTREPGPTPLTLSEQLVGVGVGAAQALGETVSFFSLLSGVKGFYDADGLREQERAFVTGLGALVREPAQTVPLLVGADLLAERRYGEWAGSVAPDLLSGFASLGAVPLLRRTASRTERLVSAGRAAGSQAPGVQGLAGARPEVGGPVTPRQGALMAARIPVTIADLTARQRAHVLADARRSPALPPRWSADQTVAAVMQAATRPLSSVREGGRVVHESRVDGVTVRVSLTEDGVVQGVELLQDAHAER